MDVSGLLWRRRASTLLFVPRAVTGYWRPKPDQSPSRLTVWPPYAKMETGHRPRHAKGGTAEVEQDRQPAKEPFALLETKREEILAAWIDLIEQLPASQVMERPVPDLHALRVLGLDALIGSLRTGSSGELESYLVSLYNAYLRVDGDISDAIDALFLLKASTMSVLRESIPCGSIAMLDACARMDSYLRHSVTFLARRHAMATNNQLRERQERTSTLLEILRAAASTLDLDKVLHYVAEAIRSVTSTSGCGFCLIDEERGLLIPHYAAETERSEFAAGSSSRTPALPLSNLGSFERHVLETREPAVSVNVEEDHRVLRYLTRPLGIKSMLAIPFVVRGRVVAIAYALAYEVTREFDQEEIDLASGIANAVGLAIENARLHQRTKGMAIVEERDRLAREMHDNLAQALSALQLKASQVASALTKGATEQAQSTLDELQEWISEVHTDVREAIFDMRTIVLPGEDFWSTLQGYLDAYQTRYGVEVELHAEATPPLEMAGDIGFQAMRIIQEALTNVRKHAGTNQATIQIERKEGQVLIKMCDEGRGFDRARQAQAGHCLGLQVMAERAESIGGTLAVESQPGRGTCVVLSFPISGNRRS